MYKKIVYVILIKSSLINFKKWDTLQHYFYEKK